MEKPQGRLTNFHHIEGVLFVQWTTYTFDETTAPQLKHSNRHTLLESAASELRKNSHYALYDRARHTLWHFVPSGPEVVKDHNTAQKSSHATAIISQFGLKRITSGSLRATDVSEAAVNLLDDVEDVGQNSTVFDANNASFQSNQSSSTPTPKQDGGSHLTWSSQATHENLQIYIRVLIALEKTVACDICATGKWLLVAPGVFCPRWPLDLGNGLFGMDDGDRVDFGKLVRLRVTWLFSGHVVMFRYPLEDHENSMISLIHEPPKRDTVPALVAPLGIIGYLKAGVQFNLSGQGDQNVAAQWRSFVQGWLERRGITLAKSNKWSVVYRPVDTHSTHPRSTVTFVWPAELCLLIKQSPERTDLAKKESGPIRDLLAEAEDWTLNQDSQKFATEEDQTNKRRGKPVNAEPCEEDDYIHLFPRNDNMLDVQALTGIYPTPPDAPRPQTFTSGDDRAEQNTVNSDVRTPMETEGRTPKVTFDDKVETEAEDVDMGSFDPVEEDDLFGNMNGDEFNNNGVTEDDFSFFDEPGDTPANTETILTTPSHAHSVDVVQVSSSPDADKIFAMVSPDTVPLEAQTELEANQEPRQEQQRQQQQQQKAVSFKDHHDPDYTLLPNYESPTTTILVTTQPEPAENAFATKYGQKGKFSTNTPSPHGTVLGRGPSIQNSIPSIPKPIEETDSGEESDDSDMMSDLRRSLPEIGVQDSENDSPRKPDYTAANKEFSGEDELNEFYGAVQYGAEEFMLGLQENCDLRNGSTVKRENFQTLPTNLDAHVKLAQVFADQMIRPIVSPSPARLPHEQTVHGPMADDDLAGQVMRSLFPRGSQCPLQKLANLTEDGVNPAVGRRSTVGLPMKRSETGRLESMSTAGTITPIHPPAIRTKRGDRQMEISYTALRFWEDLGLSPFAGVKNITAFCLFPEQEVVRRGARSFLTMMKSTYTSLRLGSHQGGHAAMKGYRDGLVTIPPADNDDEEMLNQSCEKLGQALRTLASNKSTIVVYMINEQSGSEGTKRLCSAFIKLFEAYAGSLRFTTTTPADIVLKVLPMSWMASSWTIAMPSVVDLVQLSKEIYDRCPHDHESANPYASRSLIELAEPVPRSLDFKLTYESLANPFHKETFAHVAYCWDRSSIWLNASLTDTSGCHSWSAAFLVGQGVERWDNFKMVAQEIFEIVQESVGDVHGKVKLLVYKDGEFAKEEKDVWASISKDVPYALLQLDPNPPLFLQDEKEQKPPFDWSLVPDPIPSTPGGTVAETNAMKLEEIDPAARVVDLDEEAWAVVTTRSLDLDRNRDARALLAHGYLIKRDRAVLSLSIVHGIHDVDVKELLGVNQGLICVAKGRGLHGEQPWHMAVARRAQDGMMHF